MNLEKNLLNFLNEYNIILENKKVVLAVSTGVDSSVLLDLFLKLRKELNYELIVCHVNHHKRSQSDEEEAYIKDYAKEEKFTLFVKDLYFESTKNFQEEARNKRYEFFDEVMDNIKADYLVLAHQLDDNVETILMRILRGGSITSLQGIKEVSKRNDFYVLRPLLRVSKEEIYSYQKANNIKYYEDESNHHTDYQRNKIRLEIIPKLKEIMPNLNAKFYDFSKKMENASIIVNEKRDEFIHSYVKNVDNNIVIDKDKYLELSEFLRNEVLFEVLKKYKLSTSNIDELNKIILSKKPNILVNYKDLFSFETTYDTINIKTITTKKENDKVFIEITDPGEYHINDKIKLIVRKKDKKEVVDVSNLCYNIITLPVVIRSKKPGDKMKLKIGTKKISDILIDEKVLKNKRDDVLLLEKDNEILSILGIKKSIILTKMNKCDIILELVKLDN